MLVLAALRVLAGPPDAGVHLRDGHWRPVPLSQVPDHPPPLPVPATRYSFGPPTAAHDGGVPIDVDGENRSVTVAIAEKLRERPGRPLIIVPGFSLPGSTVPMRLHPVARARARLAKAALKEHDGVAILVTGGNVHPEDTPYNEALELKRYLMSLRVPEASIAVEPHARHSTTNLRNAGRFMKAHGIEHAVVITTWFQSFYYGAEGFSGFHDRCRQELGYRVGKLTQISTTSTHFVPSSKVMRRGDDALDP